MRVMLVFVSALALVAAVSHADPAAVKSLVKEIVEPSDLLAQETQQGGGNGANWFDVIHNDDLWNQNIKDGPGKQMLISLEKEPQTNHAPLAGPPPHIRPPPNYTPQKPGWQQDSQEQPANNGWQNNGPPQGWNNGPAAQQHGGWQQQGTPPQQIEGWQGPKSPAPAAQGWQQGPGPQAAPGPRGEGKKVVILVSLPNGQQSMGYGASSHGHGHGGHKAAPMEMIEGIRQKHNSAPVVYVSLDKGGNAHSPQHFPAKGGHASHGGHGGPAGPQKVVLLFVKEKGQGGQGGQGGHGGGGGGGGHGGGGGGGGHGGGGGGAAGWVQGGPVQVQRKRGGYGGGPQLNTGWNDGPINNDINVGGGGWSNNLQKGSGGWSAPQKDTFQQQGWSKTVTASYNTGGHGGGGGHGTGAGHRGHGGGGGYGGGGYGGGTREKGMGYFTGQPEIIKNKIQVQGWDQEGGNNGPQQGWEQKQRYGSFNDQPQSNFGSPHQQQQQQPVKGGGGGGSYGRPTEPFDDELPVTKPGNQNPDNGGWQPIVSKPGTEGWVPRPTAPPNKKGPAYAPKKQKPAVQQGYNRVEKTTFEQTPSYGPQQQQQQHGYQQQQQNHQGQQQQHHHQQQTNNNYHGHQQQQQHHGQQQQQQHHGHQQQQQHHGHQQQQQHHEHQQQQQHHGHQQQQQHHGHQQQQQHHEHQQQQQHHEHQQQQQHHGQQQQQQQDYHSNNQQHQSHQQQQQHHSQQSYGNQQQSYNYNQQQQQQGHYESYNSHNDQKSYGSFSDGAGNRPGGAAGGGTGGGGGSGGYGRPNENFDPEDIPSPGYGGAGKPAAKPAQNPYTDSAWKQPAAPAPTAAIHQHGSQGVSHGPKPPPAAHPTSIQDIRNAQGWQPDNSSAQPKIDPRENESSSKAAPDLPKMQHWTPQYAASSPVAASDNTHVPSSGAAGAVPGPVSSATPVKILDPASTSTPLASNGQM